MVIKKVHSHHKFMWKYLMEVFWALTRPAMVFLFFMSVSLLISCASGFYYFELGHNPKVITFLDAFYYSITIFTGVGLGDIFPVTTHGRIISMVMMIVGTGIYVSLTAVIATTIMTIETTKKDI
jgi:voltage-gated potassium channel